ncbi:DUF2182 domain-containing protein [Aurantimonas sp. E1-2-R+4]|uniref:copper chaperone n=1 Tax=Aurantimonas sp. E1-2-R+4 TaxID=3113714 RepID=UPI002F944728
MALSITAGLAWVILALGSGSVAIPTICTAALLWSVPSADAFIYVLAVVSPLKLAIGWAVMVVAMMLPTLYDPLLYLRERSFRRLRPWSQMLFIGGYVSVWMAAGAAFIGVALTMRLSSSVSFLPLILASTAALIWQASPWKQHALNKCHRRPSLAAFAPAVFVDATLLGVRNGLWCVASCWGLMMVAMSVPAFHVATMIFVAFIVWAERLEPSRQPAWQLCVPLKMMRLIAWFATNP